MSQAWTAIAEQLPYEEEPVVVPEDHNEMVTLDRRTYDVLRALAVRSARQSVMGKLMMTSQRVKNMSSETPKIIENPDHSWTISVQ